jgi:hypothetical protein
MDAPNAADARPTWRRVIVVRRAAMRAPANEPRLSTEKSSVKAVSPPPSDRRTNSGTTTLKLKASVPTSVVIISGIQRSGSERT